jgi:hypothetical protein
MFGLNSGSKLFLINSMHNAKIVKSSPMLTQLMVRNFYYPDHNHHHQLSQEVNKIFLIILYLASRFGEENHQISWR